MGDAGDQDRQQLVRRALGGRRTRSSHFTREKPTKWHPTSLLNPADRMPFTEDNCWTFIADAITAGVPMEEIILRQPPGKRGFVIKLEGCDGVTIYVKLQLLADTVLGRSFHQSTGYDDEDE